MTELKTRRNDASVARFIGGIADEGTRSECRALVKLMRAATGAPPKMWGASIVGFGSYHYRGASGREGDWFVTGFSPRKQNLTIYIMAGFEPYGALMKKLGPHKTGKSCLYVRTLDDLHRPTLKRLVESSVARMAKLHR